MDWNSIRTKAGKIMSLVGVDIDLDACLGDLPVVDKQ